MCENIVIFGPTHSGKSTLLGYLKVYDWNYDEYIRGNIRNERKMEELGLKYKKDRALSYYVDEGIDERTIYNKRISSQGTSKRIHIVKPGLGIELNCAFIDTPGSDVAWKHKHEGLFLGEIGVFLIEISKLTDLSRKVVGSNSYNMKVNELFSPLYLWKHYRRMKRLIIAISKIDLASYSSYAISRAENTLRSIDILKEVPIVPICIDVENKTSHNVIDCKCKEMEWYQGRSLIDEIKDMVHKELRETTEYSSAFAHIERLIPKTKSNNQPAVRIKMLNGAIHIGDTIYLGPVKYNKQTVVLKGTVLSLLHETRGLVDVLTKGEIGGIIFSKLWADRERLKLTDVQLKRTSMIYQDVQECRRGNLLYFNIDKNNLKENVIQYLESITIGSRVKLIWFGKIICVRLLNIIADSQKYNIVLMNTTSSESMFMLPLKENGKLLYEQYVLQLSDLLFVNAYLSDLETISNDSKREIIFIFEGEIDNIGLLKSLKVDMEYFYNQKTKETSIIWKNLTDKNIKKVVEVTVKFLKSRKIEYYKVDILPQKKENEKLD